MFICQKGKSFKINTKRDMNKYKNFENLQAEYCSTERLNTMKIL